MKSIRGRLTLWLVVASSLFLLMAAVLLNHYMQVRLAAFYDEQLLLRAQSLITQTEQDREGIDLDFVSEFMPESAAPEGPEFFEIWYPYGVILVRSNSLVQKNLPLDHSFTPQPVYGRVTTPSGVDCRFVRMSFFPNQEDDIEGSLDDLFPNEAFTLVLARDIAPFNRVMRSLQIGVFTTFAFLLLLPISLVRPALERGLKPLNDIGDQVRAIDPSAFGQPIQLSLPTEELQPIVDQLNGTLARLASAMDRERRFTSDVAHELRTPLAELKSLTEVFAKLPFDLQTSRSFFQDVLNISLEMEDMVNNLLALSRCDSGRQWIHPEWLDLRNLAEKTWQRALRSGLAAGKNLNLDVPPDTHVYSDMLMFEHILQNLLSNAALHSHESSDVDVAWRWTTDRGLLRISNLAEHLEPADLAFLFDRFWRKDPARTERQNSGLGLALVQAFCEVLGYAIRVDLDDAGLFSITLAIPLSESSEKQPALEEDLLVEET